MSTADLNSVDSTPNLSILKGPIRNLQPNLLHRLFENVTIESASEKTALIFEDNDTIIRHTYNDLNLLSNRMAHVLRNTITEDNLPRNSDGDYIIAIALPPSDRLVIALLAIFKAGAAYLPIDPLFPGSRVEYIVRDAQPVLVLYDQDSKHFLETKKISIDDLMKQSLDFSDEPLKQEECLKHLHDDLAIVLYTSGSTGMPKGVRLPHKVILNRLQWQFETFPYSKTEATGVFKTVLTFVDSVSEIWGPLINGLAILIVPKAVTADPERLIDVLDRYQIERLMLVPSLLLSLLLCLELRGNRSKLLCLKTWVCSGETLSMSLVTDFLFHFFGNEFKLCNFYGSTEIMDVTYHVITNKNHLVHENNIPIGIPIDNTLLYLLDPEGHPVPTGDCGELFVSGLNLAAGYVAGRDPDSFIANAHAVEPQFAKLFKTGDFARIEKGTLLFMGRTDSQIKIRGHRVDLSEMERIFNEIMCVDKAVVLCYQPGETNQKLLAFITILPTDGTQFLGQIEQYLRTKCSAYMIPQLILLDSIPLLVNGKVDRQLLLSGYENTYGPTLQAQINYTGVEKPQMDAATVLFETVASILSHSTRAAICLDANFYEIGGNSLNSIYTITSINKRGYYISIDDFITAKKLKVVLERMTPSDTNKNCFIDGPQRFTSELLRDEHKQVVISMITSSFNEKADLEQWLMPYVFTSEYTELLNAIWEPLVEKRLSFVSRDKYDKVVGVSLNFDARDEPEFHRHSTLLIISEYLESIEGPVRDNMLPPGKNVALHSYMMGTHETLTSADNVAVMKFMEDEVFKLAKERKFFGIFTTNVNPLTQQLACDIYGYTTMIDSQVNTFALSADNSKPFQMAPDSQRSLVQWKVI